MTVHLSISGNTVSTANTPTREILVGTVEGIVRLRRERPGAPWHDAGRSLQKQQVNALTREPTRGLLFAGTQDAGLHVSADNGCTWERRDHGIAQSRVWTVSYTQAGGQVKLYAGVEPAHLYVSEDLGESWTELTAMRDVPTV